jgi:hypothetical protein
MTKQSSVFRYHRTFKPNLWSYFAYVTYSWWAFQYFSVWPTECIVLKFIINYLQYSRILFHPHVQLFHLLTEVLTQYVKFWACPSRCVLLMYWIYLFHQHNKQLVVMVFTTCFDSHESSSGYVQNLLVLALLLLTVPYVVGRYEVVAILTLTWMKLWDLYREMLLGTV